MSTKHGRAVRDEGELLHQLLELLDRLLDVLAELPGIEREVETPPDPDELTVETYADVLSARQEIDVPPTTVWRFNPDA